MPSTFVSPNPSDTWTAMSSRTISPTLSVSTRPRCTVTVPLAVWTKAGKPPRRSTPARSAAAVDKLVVVAPGLGTVDHAVHPVMPIQRALDVEIAADLDAAALGLALVQHLAGELDDAVLHRECDERGQEDHYPSGEHLQTATDRDLANEQGAHHKNKYRKKVNELSRLFHILTAR
jgi:hypothetical protein